MRPPAAPAGSRMSSWSAMHAIEVAAEKELPLGRDAGQEMLNEECCPPCRCAWCIDAGYCECSPGKGEVHAERAAVG